MSAQAAPAKAAKRRTRLIEVAPDSERPEASHKLSPAKGLLIGAGICAAFWGAIAAAVLAAR